MTRNFIDCREMPSQANCSLRLSADNEQELLEAAVQHAISVHQEQDSPELRQELRRHFHTERGESNPLQ
jgi:predicted small metal-binding protein